MWSTPSRRRLASQERMRWWRDRPASLGPSPIGMRALVASRTRSRRPRIVRPTISSDRPAEYTSAVSMRLTPASRHMSTWRVPPSTSVLPTLANFSRPPKVMVPRVRADTRSPECPSWRYSIARSLRQRGARHGPAVLEQQPLELARRHLAGEHVDAVAVLERDDVAREPARVAGQREVARGGALL